MQGAAPAGQRMRLALNRSARPTACSRLNRIVALRSRGHVFLMSREEIEIVNPPHAAMVDDLVAAAIVLRSAEALVDREQHQAVRALCAKAAARLEEDAAALRGA